jgi:hypothetical protein
VRTSTPAFKSGLEFLNSFLIDEISLKALEVPPGRRRNRPRLLTSLAPRSASKSAVWVQLPRIYRCICMI